MERILKRGIQRKEKMLKNPKNIRKTVANQQQIPQGTHRNQKKMKKKKNIMIRRLQVILGLILLQKMLILKCLNWHS